MKRTRSLRVAGAAVLAVALTSCVKMDIELDINADDTIDGSMTMAISKEFADMAGAMGEDTDLSDMFGGFGEDDDVPEYAEIEPYEDDEYEGQRITFNDAPLEDFNSGDDLSSLSIVREGEEFVLNSDMDMTDTEGMGDMEEVPEGMLEGMDFDMRVSVTFPGEVLETNGEVEGTTVTWMPQIGETNEMFARSADSGAGGDSFPAWLWIVIAAVIIAGLVGLLFVFSRSKGGAAPAAAPAADAGGGSAPPVAGGPGAGTPPPPAPGSDAGPGSDAAPQPSEEPGNQPPEPPEQR